MRGRGLILAAPASGSGKTLITLGLLRHLAGRGVRVAAAKAGPDYIDPTFLAAASGGTCVNLDVWAMRPTMLAALVDGLESAAELVLCEGVMGLFDGTGATGETGSTADLARLTGWPVVLVVDAGRQGASIAALIGGFAGHDPRVALDGVIFNRVASARHRSLLEGAVARHLPDLPCLGAVPADPTLRLPARHLGLVPAAEAGESDAVIERAAAQVAAALDIDRLLALARPAACRGDAESSISAPLPPLGQRIAIARDDAFAFLYCATLQGWRRQGAELCFFSPLADEPPDPDADAVYLPGGYPELHAGRLAAAARFLAGLRRAAEMRMPVYGECGGYMVLGESLVDGDGRCFPMAGLLPVATSFAAPRLHLGYRRARLVGAGPLGPAGSGFRGHEFHYATTLREGTGEPLFALRDACGDDLGNSGMRRGTVGGSFVHLIDRCRS